MRYGSAGDCSHAFTETVSPPALAALPIRIPTEVCTTKPLGSRCTLTPGILLPAAYDTLPRLTVPTPSAPTICGLSASEKKFTDSMPLPSAARFATGACLRRAARDAH